MLDVITVSGSDAELGATIARNASFGATDSAFDLSVGAARAALRETPEVAAAALGNPRYLEFLDDPSTRDWLINSFGYRSHLAPQDNGSWLSPEGLLYRGFGDPGFETRVDHVLDHTRPRLDRTDTDRHGYFVDELVGGNPLAVVDEAWVLRSQAVSATQRVEGGTIVSVEYLVDLERPIGRISGSLGERLGFPPTNFVTVVVDFVDESRIVTAFPTLVPNG